MTAPAPALAPAGRPDQWDRAGSLAALAGAGAGVRLFIGGHAGRVLGPDGQTWERETLAGDRCFTAAHPADTLHPKAGPVTILLDSGAFTDVGRQRLTPEAALARQLRWERALSTKWGMPMRAAYLASYDLLIDEVWLPGQGKVKRRWSVSEADRAVRVTVEAAAFLHTQRVALAPRTLVLGVQGVDAAQYQACVEGVLTYARPGDWIGLGGWCILGRFRSWLPVFYETISRCLPLIAAAGVGHVHLYGVLYRPALGRLAWLAHAYGLTVSTDSSAPLMAYTRRDTSHTRPLAADWRDAAAIWRLHLAQLDRTPDYQPPMWQGSLLC